MVQLFPIFESLNLSCFYIILYFPITYRHTSVFCPSACASLHKTINIVVFIFKCDEKPYPKERSLV